MKSETVRQSLLHLNAKALRSFRSFSVVLALTFFSVSLYGQSTLLEREVNLSDQENTVIGHVDDLLDSEGISLIFNSGRVDLNRVVILQSTAVSVNDLIIQLFPDQTLELRASDNKVLITFGTKAPQTFSVRGYVRDIESGEVLAGASVVEANTQTSTFTSESGFYSIKVPAEQNQLVFSYLGYDAVTFVDLADGQHDVQMSFDNELTQVVISESISDNYLPGSGSERIDLALTKGFRATDGGNDILQAVRFNPGVQSGNEGQSGLLVRGGSNDQNLILFEGIPLYEVSHTAGFSSMFIEESIHNVDFIKNGFPARYGGRLSSVLNVQLKDGNKSNLRGSVNASLPSIKAHLEGPIFGGRTTFNVSGRASYLDRYINEVLGDLVSFDIGLEYQDLVFKMTHRFSPSRKVSFSFYTGGDDSSLFREQANRPPNGDVFSAQNTSAIKWGSTVWNFNYSNIVNDKLQLNMNFGGVRYQYSSRSSYKFAALIDGIVSSAERDVVSFSAIEDFLANANFDYYLSDMHILKFGGGWIYHQYNPAVRSLREIQDGILEELSSDDDIIRTDELSAYIEDTYSPSDKWQVYAGVHFSGFNVGRVNYRNTQPRFSLIFNPNEKNRTALSYTKMNQYVHLLVNPGLGLPSDLWVPSTEDIRPEEARQLSVSHALKISESLNFSISTYYKWMDNLLEYRTSRDLYFIGGTETDPPPVEIDPDWRNRVEIGSSTSKGIEFALQKTSGQWTGWATYVLAKTDRQFDSINDGVPFPYKYDRRHDINLGIKYQLNEKISLTSNWTYGTGNRFSLSIEAFDTDLGTFLTPSGRNNFIFAPYHHLDFLLNYEKVMSNSNRFNFNIGVYNAYNRRNPYFIYIYRNDVTRLSEARQVSIFPIFPTLNIGYSF